MRHSIVHHTSGDRFSNTIQRSPRREPVGAWSFVYVFFTNGIPFDSPNRSEPCPRS